LYKAICPKRTLAKITIALAALALVSLTLAACSSNNAQSGDSQASSSGAATAATPGGGAAETIRPEGDTTEATQPAFDPAYDTGYDENANSSILFTDGEYVYANGQAGVFRINKDEKTTASLIFSPGNTSIISFVVYKGNIYFALGMADNAPGNQPMPLPSLYRYDIASGETVDLGEDIQPDDISLRGNILYCTSYESSNEPPPADPFVAVQTIYQIRDDFSLARLDSDPNPQGRYYFTEYHDEASNDLYSAKADGSDRVKLATVFSNYYTVAYNRIFYTAYDTKNAPGQLWSVYPDGTDAKPLSADDPTRDKTYKDINWRMSRIVDFDKDYLYVAASSYSDAGLSFFRMKYDGTDRLDYPALQRDSGSPGKGPVEAMAGWIYSRSDSGSPLVRMKADGTGGLHTEPFG